MVIFAVIVLIVIIIALTHIHNWAIRIASESGDAGDILIFIVSIIYALAMFFTFKYLILWAYPIITN